MWILSFWTYQRSHVLEWKCTEIWDPRFALEFWPRLSRIDAVFWSAFSIIYSACHGYIFQ